MFPHPLYIYNVFVPSTSSLSLYPILVKHSDILATHPLLPPTLVLGEFQYYQGIDRVDELYVDTRTSGLLSILLNITFPAQSAPPPQPNQRPAQQQQSHLRAKSNGLVLHFHLPVFPAVPSACSVRRATDHMQAPLGLL